MWKWCHGLEAFELSTMIVIERLEKKHLVSRLVLQSSEISYTIASVHTSVMCYKLLVISYDLFDIVAYSTMYQLYIISLAPVWALKAIVHRILYSWLQSSDKNMHNNVNANAKTQHTGNNAKAHKILRCIIRGEQVGAIDLCKVTQSVHER